MKTTGPMKMGPVAKNYDSHMEVNMIKNAKWITATKLDKDVVPTFRKCFSVKKEIEKAELYMTALGVYEAFINEFRVGEFVLAPGWTSYEHRLQYQCYDITQLLAEENEICVQVGRGWFSSPLGTNPEMMARNVAKPKALLALLHIRYTDGTEDRIMTDESWEYSESAIRFSEIYDGESYDATFAPKEFFKADILAYRYDTLLMQEGEEVREQERVYAKQIIVTPEGDVLVDFGQEVTGYVEFTVNAHKGDRVHILHSEVLDKHGNFYNENYRLAKAEIHYICKEGVNKYHPRLTFFGFRQIKLDVWPGDLKDVKPEQFCAIAVYSNIRKTGHLASSNPMLNQFFSNVFWGQRGNFLDIPTDCPQRNERLGWTGDAQVFCKAAGYNFNVLRFFKKWLKDLYVDQIDCKGIVTHIVPDIFKNNKASAAWSDCATVIPWQLYMTYGDKEVLENQFDSMKMWVDRITQDTKVPYLWAGCWHYGDWLALDAPSGSYRGSSREDVLATAFYAYSTQLLVKAGKALGRNVSEYEVLYANIVDAFQTSYPEYKTQAEHALALYFGLAKDPQKTAESLANLIRTVGKMETGFVGTPYLLHALSDHGYAELAYDLLLRESYPSWLYSVSKGATTVWEHWDGIMENGDFWSKDMNSFNHYAYGAAIDWVYEKAAGIRPAEPGFARVIVEPIPTGRLDWLEVSIETAHGLVSSGWSHAEGKIRYNITLPVTGDVIISGVKHTLPAGNYVFWG